VSYGSSKKSVENGSKSTAVISLEAIAARAPSRERSAMLSAAT
jgi:hypothetical protein